MTKKTTALIIPTMNRPESLKQTLSTYYSAKIVPSQLIVVDQSGTPELRQQTRILTEQYRDRSDVVYVYQEIPSSSHARNTGMLLANTDILVFSDDDVDVKKDTLYRITERMEDNSIAMIAGLPDRQFERYPFIGYFTGNKSIRYRKIGNVSLSMLGRYPIIRSGEIATQWAMGYFFAVQTDLVKKWDIHWDENMTGYSYAEDLDFTYSYYKKATEAGMRCILSHDIRVLHRHSMEFRTPSQKSTYMFVINRAYLGYKHSTGWKGIVVTQWCDFCMIISRIITRQHPMDMIRAERYLKKNRKKIKKGNLCVKKIF